MIAFMCAAMVAVESLLYSLLQSMGLIGGSYADIANAFPDNTSAQNTILYSIANDPIQNSGGFNTSYEFDEQKVLDYFHTEFFLAQTLSDNWDLLMQDLGFAVVDNNVQFAVSQGYNPSPDALNYIGTLESATGEKLICTYVGCANTMFRNIDRIPDGVSVSLGVPTYENYVGDVSVFRWEYDDTVVYSTSRFVALNSYISVQIGDVVRFEVVNNSLRFRVYRRGALYWDIPFSKDFWINQGIAIDDALVFDPTQSVVMGEEYLSFGDADNPVVSVSYDPATGVTTYQYQDGTTSTTPPATLSDTITLSPSITQPLTNYIINEGDITNIYNPDAAIPSDSSVPFDFISLGDLLYKEFTPMLTPDFKPPLNRLIAKYDWETPFKKLAQKFNITCRRPSYPVTFTIFGRSITWDFWDWCDTLLTPSNYSFYLKFVRFFLYFTMVSGCIALLLRSLHVSIKTVHFGGDD